jgi:hypothetical protein
MRAYALVGMERLNIRARKILDPDYLGRLAWA